MRKGISALALVCASSMLLTGCYSTAQQSADAERAQQQEKNLEEAARQVPAPAVRNFNELRMFKATMERRDEVDLPTWTYTKNMDGKYTWLCESLGFGIPYNTRANNPMHYEYLTTLTGSTSNTTNGCNGDNGYWDSVHNRCIWGTHAVVPQAEPNGLFIPESAKGTWNTCRNPSNGKPTISYQEEDVSVFEYRLPDGMVEGFHPAPLPPADPKEVAKLLPEINDKRVEAGLAPGKIGTN